MTGFVNSDSKTVSGTTLTMSKPSGTTDGDFMIMYWLYINSSGPVESPPAGWTQSASTAYVANNWAIYTKTASSEPATWDFALDLSKRQWGILVVYRGYQIVSVGDWVGNQNNGYTTGTGTNTFAPVIQISTWFDATATSVDAATVQRGYVTGGGDELWVADETLSTTSRPGRTLVGGSGIDQTWTLDLKATCDPGTWEVILGPEPGAETTSRDVKLIEKADFLVGTAQDVLTNEIVVGTTPNGELGGTWQNITVDPIHSGSPHAAGYGGGEGAEGPQGPPGPQGATGAAGAPGSPANVATDTIWDAKGDLAAGTGADTAARVAVGADWTVLTASSAASTGVAWANVPWVAGALVASTTINNTVTPTTGGVTYAAPAIAAGQVYRLTAIGKHTSASSATARSAQIAPFWGSTALQTSSFSVLTLSARTTQFIYVGMLTGIDATHIWQTSATTEEIRTLTTARVGGNGTPASTAVTAGAQTLDLRFSWSVSVAGDQWIIESVVLERLA